jgi:hypothetical protein
MYFLIIFPPSFRSQNNTGSVVSEKATPFRFLVHVPDEVWV